MWYNQNSGRIGLLAEVRYVYKGRAPSPTGNRVSRTRGFTLGGESLKAASNIPDTATNKTNNVTRRNATRGKGLLLCGRRFFVQRGQARVRKEITSRIEGGFPWENEGKCGNLFFYEPQGAVGKEGIALVWTPAYPRE